MDKRIINESIKEVSDRTNYTEYGRSSNDSPREKPKFSIFNIFRRERSKTIDDTPGAINRSVPAYWHETK
jgi:hypothetical protein